MINLTRTKKPVKRIRAEGGGSKTTYQPWMADDARDIVGKLGGGNAELALYFGISPKTIDYWLRVYKDFERAVKKGRLEKTLKVSKKLYQLAVGYKCKDTQFFLHQGNIITKEYIKHYPPNFQAANKILTILARETWAENVNVNVNHMGTINYRKIDEIPVEELTQAQRELLFDINMKQLATNQLN
jgi:hypothetical protein